MSANRGPRAVVSRPASAPLGRWLSDGAEPVADAEALREALADLNRPVLLIESALIRLKASLPGRTYGFNLIHSPNEQSLESATVDLFLRHGLRLVEASAYLDLTPHIVRYRLSEIRRGPDGEVVTPNRVI